jgi:hypothetical protein
MAAVDTNQKVKLEHVDYSKLWKLTLLAGVISGIVNLLLYFGAQAIGFVGDMTPSFMAESPQPFAPAIVISSILFTAIGGVLVWVVDRFSAKPITTWRNLAIVGLFLSFAQPFAAFSNTNEIILLLLMHTLAGIIAIVTIIRAKKA